MAIKLNTTAARVCVCVCILQAVDGCVCVVCVRVFLLALVNLI